MEKINLNANRTLSEIIRASFRFLKLEGKTLFKIYSLFVLPLFILVAIITYQSDLFLVNEMMKVDALPLEEIIATLNLKKLWFAIIAQAFVWLVFLSITLIYLKNYSSNSAELLTPKVLWNELVYEFPKVFIVQFLYIGMVFFGLISFVIPGIYFGVSLALTTTIVVFEDSKIFFGLRKSFKLIGAKWFMSFGYLLVFYLIYLAVRTVLQLPISIIDGAINGADEMSKMSFTITSTLSAIVNMFASIIPIIGTVFLYYILKQHEASLSKDM